MSHSVKPRFQPESETSSVPTVLIAEDDTELRRLLARTLRADGLRVIEARDGEELTEHLAAARTRRGAWREQQRVARLAEG